MALWCPKPSNRAQSPLLTAAFTLGETWARPKACVTSRDPSMNDQGCPWLDVGSEEEPRLRSGQPEARSSLGKWGPGPAPLLFQGPLVRGTWVRSQARSPGRAGLLAALPLTVIRPVQGSQCLSSTGPACRSVQCTPCLCMPARPRGLSLGLAPRVPHCQNHPCQRHSYIHSAQNPSRTGPHCLHQDEGRPLLPTAMPSWPSPPPLRNGRVCRVSGGRPEVRSSPAAS